jgi:hypothetical protein
LRPHDVVDYRERLTFRGNSVELRRHQPVRLDKGDFKSATSAWRAYSLL